MKYEIQKSKLDDIMYKYIVDMFENNEMGELSLTNNFDEEGNETEDSIEFYFGDYGDDYEAFRWYSEEYFDDDCERCPIVELSYELKNNLDLMFNNLWKPIFKKWIKENYDLEVKTIQ